MQVLSLEIEEKSSPSSKLEEKQGKKFECRIICEDGSQIIADENVVFEYSPYLRNNIVHCKFFTHLIIYFLMFLIPLDLSM